MYVGIGKGFFRDEGIDLQTPTMASSTAVAAMLSGQVDFAVAGSGVRAAMQGAPMKAIFYYYNTTLFEMVAAPSIKSLADLKGKPIGATAPNSTDEIVARILLQKAGLNPAKDVTFVTVTGGAEVATLVSGAIQAMVMNPDVGAKAEKQGFHVVVPIKEVGQALPSPFSGFMATDDTLKNKPAMLKAWLRANIKALEYVRDHPDESGMIAAKVLNMDPDIAKRALPPTIEAIDNNDLGGFTEAGFNLEIQTDLKALKGDAKVKDIKQLADLTLLHQVQKEMGVPCKTGYQCK